MPIPFALRIDKTASNALSPIFDIIQNPDTQAEARDNALTALVLVAREIGTYNGAMETHLIHGSDIAQHRKKEETHIPTTLYPDNLSTSQRELRPKLQPLIGEDTTDTIIAALNSYVAEKLKQSAFCVRGSY